MAIEEANVGHVLSSKKVVQGGSPTFEELISGAAVTPGALVKRSAAGKVVEVAAATDEVLGVADIIAVRGQEADTDIAQGETVRVAKGHFYWRATIASGTAAQTKGAKLKPAANGELTAFVEGTDPDYQAVAVLESDTVDASAAAKKALVRRTE